MFANQAAASRESEIETLVLCTEVPYRTVQYLTCTL